MPKVVDHEARRHEIAVAACKAIALKGLDGITLAEVARQAGYTTGMLAHYFDNKWDVVLAALRLMHDRLESRLSDRLKAHSNLTDLLADALPTTAEHRAESAAWLAFWGVAANRPDLLKWSSETHADWRGLMRRCVLETNAEARKWPDQLIEDVVSSLILFMDGIYVKALTRPSMYPAKAQVRLLAMHIEVLLGWAETNAESYRHPRENHRTTSKTKLSESLLRTTRVRGSKTQPARKASSA